MPIKHRDLYPPDWPDLASRLKEAAGWCCQGSPAYPDCRAKHGEAHPVTGSVVILTVAHLDHNPANNNPANLRVWCQRCHNIYDQPHRLANRRLTLARQKGQKDG